MAHKSAVQRYATAAALANMLVLSVIQIIADTPPPFLLYLVFVGIWTLASFIVWTLPMLGGLATLGYGAYSAWQVIQMHGQTPNALVTAGAAGIAAVLGLLLVVQRLVGGRKKTRPAAAPPPPPPPPRPAAAAAAPPSGSGVSDRDTPEPK